MIALLINGQALDLEDSTRAQLNFHNSAFDDDIIIGDYSLPFTIPLSPRNRKVLGFSDMVNLAGRMWSYPCILLKGTIPLISGFFEVTEVNKKTRTATGNIRYGLAGLTVTDMLLKDIDYGGDIVLDEFPGDFEIFGIFQNIILENYPVVPFNFPMHKNSIFYKLGDVDLNPDFTGIINYWYADTIENNRPYNLTTLIPFPYLMFVLEKGFWMDGYTIEGSFVDHPVLQQLCIQNNYALDERENEDNARWKAHLDNDQTITGEDDILFDTDFAPDGYDPANRYDPGTGIGLIAEEGMHDIEVKINYDFDDNGGSSYDVVVRIYKGASLLHMNILNLLTAGTGSFTVHPAAFAFTNADIGVPMRVTVEITSNVPGAFFRSVEDGSYWKVTNLTNQGYNVFAPVMNIQNHVPNIKFGELLTAISTAYKLQFTFDYKNKVVSIDFVNDYIEDDPVHWEKKALKDHIIRNDKTAIKNINYEFPDDDELVKGNFLIFDGLTYLGEFTNRWDLPAPTQVLDFAYVESQAKYYQVKIVDTVKTWVAIVDNYYDIPINENGEIEIRAKCPPMFMTDVELHGLNYLMPHIEQKGTSLAFGTGINPCSLRLVLWGGLQYDKDNSQTYPFATSNRFTANGNSLWNLILQFEYDFNLIDLFLEKWLRMMSNNEFFIKEMKLHLLDLVKLNVNKKVFFDQAQFLIKNLGIGVGKDLGITTIECYKIN